MSAMTTSTGTSELQGVLGRLGAVLLERAQELDPRLDEAALLVQGLPSGMHLTIGARAHAHGQARARAFRELVFDEGDDGLPDEQGMRLALALDDWASLAGWTSARFLVRRAHEAEAGPEFEAAVLRGGPSTAMAVSADGDSRERATREGRRWDPYLGCTGEGEDRLATMEQGLLHSAARAPGAPVTTGLHGTSAARAFADPDIAVDVRSEQLSQLFSGLSGIEDLEELGRPLEGVPRAERRRLERLQKRRGIRRAT